MSPNMNLVPQGQVLDGFEITSILQVREAESGFLGHKGLMQNRVDTDHCPLFSTTKECHGNLKSQTA